MNLKANYWTHKWEIDQWARRNPQGPSITLFVDEVIFGFVTSLSLISAASSWCEWFIVFWNESLLDSRAMCLFLFFLHGDYYCFCLLHSHMFYKAFIHFWSDQLRDALGKMVIWANFIDVCDWQKKVRQISGFLLNDWAVDLYKSFLVMWLTVNQHGFKLSVQLIPCKNVGKMGWSGFWFEWNFQTYHVWKGCKSVWNLVWNYAFSMK